jgi:hypothetical protein
MDAKANLKAKLPSRRVTEGPEGVRYRSYYFALDLTTERVHQSFVGIVQPNNSEITSGYVRKYARQHGSALNGAVTNPGAAAETSTYADI